MGMRLGYTMMTEQAGPKELVGHVVGAEDVGFDFAVTSDHYFPWLDEMGHSPHAWTVLGAAAQATSRIPLMTYVTCPTVRYHPAVVAQKAATLQILSDGRFTLGLGAGENLNEHIVGGGWPPADVRQEMLVEAIQIIGDHFDGEGYTNFRGEHFDVESAKLWDLPVTRVPIGVAVSGQQSCRIAGELGDLMVAVEPQAELGEWFDAAGGAGKPRVGQLPICFDTDKDAAVARAHSLFRWFGLGSRPRSMPTPASPTWPSCRSAATSRSPSSSGAGRPCCPPGGRRSAAEQDRHAPVGVRSPRRERRERPPDLDHRRMTEDLDRRLRRLQASGDADALIDLGCDLADADRQDDAEWCFRRAAELGDTMGWFNLGNTLAAQHRWEEAVTAYEMALSGGEADAWRNLGLVLEDLGDLAGAMRAYRGAVDAGDFEGGLQLAFLLREQGEREQAMTVAEEIAAAGDAEAAAVVACWRWCATLDPSLEDDLRAGQQHFPAARSDLAHLLRETGRPVEARAVLERGAKLGEQVAWLPLGNLYREEMGDDEAAEEAYRSGINAGDTYCHHNLAVLLADRGDLDGAVEQFRLGAAAGDQLAAQSLKELEQHG